MIITQPKEGEYTPYLGAYIQLVPGNDLINYFETQQESAATIAASLSEEQLNHRYADGKWSIKGVCSHLIDTERIFAYRALTIARNDKTEMPGFEENDYVITSNADDRTGADIIADFNASRRSTIELFKSFDATMLDRIGIANGTARSARAMGFAIAGHEIHHLKVIRERYLS
ncbi:MAG TPA: DinB family protein [Candidatus Kapabacteria bacterium]|nr:DinB family protein [Candidatus Kapabacteria bacterium]